MALPSLPLAGGSKEGKRFNASRRLISPASFLTSSDDSERNTPKWNSNNEDYVRKKPLRHGCDRGDLVELSFAKHNVLQRCVSKLLINRPTADKIKQIGTTCFEKRVQGNHNLMLD